MTKSTPIQEFTTASPAHLRVDRDAGVLRGVKLLGLVSSNGRRYLESALNEAVHLYEDAKVNVNHSDQGPLAPREYQDRIGVLRGVAVRLNEGLFGDLHFNPKHALAEQLLWDAEHAPQNVGLSHNVLARTATLGEETIVEAIEQVTSVDLVADPATTCGLFESASELRDEATPHDAKAQAAKAQRIGALLTEHGLPLPGDEQPAAAVLVDEAFLESLWQADGEEQLAKRVSQRAALVGAAAKWHGLQVCESHHSESGATLPQSRDQYAAELGTQPATEQDAAREFVEAILAC